MKSIASSAVLTLSLIGGGAFAADLSSHKLPPLPELPAMETTPWAGFYVGLNAGGAWNASTAVNLLSAPVFVAPGIGEEIWAATSSFAASRALSTQAAGFIGGGQLGYNGRFSESFIAGVEADIQGVAGGANSARNVSLLPTPAAGLSYLTTMSASKRLDYLGTVRGRIGYLVTPTLLAYATGGLAYGGITARADFFQTIPNDTPGFELLAINAGRFSNTRAGWTLGGGLEWMFSTDWSVKAEYLYYDLGGVTFPTGVTTDQAFGALIMVSNNHASTRFDGHIARAGVNYHFNWDADPVVASY
ncbi:outer membrane beta-barrel protein [Methylocystis sp. WRRC1]|uniref:outer membrane protein n=1 Tax=Methylocystis sp. WRRC1 TaxID=1732014 RepID=UPI001D15B8C8|nr:outer membrane beta-barrel protein [Methylocystis sp. WRRC1]MCC3246253.1 outer membrane beta-barrel protein [Methylocystis sp. WRRC1]